MNTWYLLVFAGGKHHQKSMASAINIIYFKITIALNKSVFHQVITVVLRFYNRHKT